MFRIQQLVFVQLVTISRWQKFILFGKSEELAVVTMKSTIFWDMTPYTLVEIYRLTEEHFSEDNTFLDCLLQVSPLRISRLLSEFA
jgi:hypothetical protein